MNKIIYSLAILFVLSTSCTTYKEDIQFDVSDFNTLKISDVYNEWKVANFIVDPAAADSLYNNYEEDIEIYGTFQVYNNGNLDIEEEETRIEIKGGFSSTFPLKSLGLKFDHTYHNDDGLMIDVPTKPEHKIDRLKAIRLRNSGNDFATTMLKDVTLARLAAEVDLDIELMYGTPIMVFVNEVFYGLMHLRTESNANGISRLLDVDKDDITLGKVNSPGVVENKDGDFDRIDRFFAAIEAEDFDYVSSELDWSNFIDYTIFESFVANKDWPHNNVRFYAVKDGPFGFILFDTDKALTKDLTKSLQYNIDDPKTNPITDLYELMYANAEFKEQFDARFNDLIYSGKLKPEVYNNIVLEYQKSIERAMPWQINKYNEPQSYTDWYRNVEIMKDRYRQRYEHFTN